MMDAPGWDDLLDEGEEILWQGRPDLLLVFDTNARITSAIGLVCAIVALKWLSHVLTHAPGPGALAVVVPVLALIFMAVGLYLLAGHYYASVYRRARTWYTLTSKRAYLATTILGQRSLKSWDVTPALNLTLADGTPGSIWFDAGSRPQRTGFERIADAPAVLALMHKIQHGRDA